MTESEKKLLAAEIRTAIEEADTSLNERRSLRDQGPISAREAAAVVVALLERKQLL